MFDILKRFQNRSNKTIIGKSRRALKMSVGESLEHTMLWGASNKYQQKIIHDFLENSIANGGGAVYVDSSGHADVAERVHDLCSKHSRTDDLRIVDFRGTFSPSRNSRFTSNTFNPFVNGDSTSLSRTCINFYDDSGGDGAMWKARAQSLMDGILLTLLWLRDNTGLELNVGTVRDYLGLDTIINLADENAYPDLDDLSRKRVRSYLKSLPGYHEDRGKRQTQTTIDQHGYLQMQFTASLGPLSDIFSHILHSNAPEVSIERAIDERRILLFILPPQEDRFSAGRDAGRLVVSSIQNALSGTSRMPDTEGTNPRPIFRVILDNIDAYAPSQGIGQLLQDAKNHKASFLLSSPAPWPVERGGEYDRIAENVQNRIYLRLNSPRSQRHILDSPFTGADKRRLLDMKMNEAFFIGMQNSQWITIDDPEPVLNTVRTPVNTFKVPVLS